MIIKLYQIFTSAYTDIAESVRVAPANILSNTGSICLSLAHCKWYTYHIAYLLTLDNAITSQGTYIP